MNKADISLWANVISLILGALALWAILTRGNANAVMQEGSPFSITTGGSNISIGDRNPGGGLNRPASGGCGCGGGYGDYAAPNLSPIFGEALRPIPFAELPQSPMTAPKLLSNGAVM